MSLPRVKYYERSQKGKYLAFAFIFLGIASPMLLIYYLLEQGEEGKLMIDELGKWLEYYPLSLFIIIGGGGLFLKYHRVCPLCGKRGARLSESGKRSSGHMLITCKRCHGRAVTDILYCRNTTSDKMRYRQDLQFDEDEGC